MLPHFSVQGDTKKILAVIPARGGSKRIPRKNVRFLNGKPLIYYAIENARKSKMVSHVVVSTDDDEIAYYAAYFGAQVWRRDPALAQDGTTLDSVIYEATVGFEGQVDITFDFVLTLQPTSPTLTSASIDKAIKRAMTSNADSVVSMVDDTHLLWGASSTGQDIKPLYKERLNSQDLPRVFKETGGVVVSKRSVVTNISRLGKRIEPLVLPFKESIDVDNYYDWWLAEKQLQRSRVLIHTIGSNEVGLGHITRSIQLANTMIEHDVVFVTPTSHKLGIEKLKESMHPVKTYKDLDGFFKNVQRFKPAMVINDVLNTSQSLVARLKKQGIFVVNFEDLGNGASKADLVINALYDNQKKHKRVYTGHHYYCLKDELRLYGPKNSPNKNIQHILLTFGGTDPANLTDKVLRTLKATFAPDIKVSVIVGLGYQRFKALEKKYAHTSIAFYQNVHNIGAYISEADLVFTSAGRTLYEVIALDTPVIAMAQNAREMLHPIADPKNGVVFLGHHKDVSSKVLLETYQALSQSPAKRSKLIKRMQKLDLRNGIKRVKHLIYDHYDTHLERHST